MSNNNSKCLESVIVEKDSIINNLYKKIEVRDTLLNNEKTLRKETSKSLIRTENSLIKEQQSNKKLKTSIVYITSIAIIVELLTILILK